MLTRSRILCRMQSRGMKTCCGICGHKNNLGQYRTIPALRLKHRSGGCGTASALPKCSIMSGCGTRIVLRGKSPSHSATAAPASVRCFRHWRRSPCSIQYYLRFWLSSCRTSLAVSALRIMRYCLRKQNTHDPQHRRPSVRRSFLQQEHNNKTTAIHGLRSAKIGIYRQTNNICF